MFRMDVSKDALDYPETFLMEYRRSVVAMLRHEIGMPCRYKLERKAMLIGKGRGQRAEDINVITG